MTSQEAEVWLQKDCERPDEYHGLGRLVMLGNLSVWLRPSLVGGNCVR